MFSCHETCEQNDILQKVLILQTSISFIYCSFVGIKHAFYLFYTCGYVEIQILFPVTSEQKCYLWSLVIHNFSYSLFICCFYSVQWHFVSQLTNYGIQLSEV